MFNKFDKFDCIKDRTVIKCITSLKQILSSGLDRFTVPTYKYLIKHNLINKTTSYIFNLSISKSILPDSFKTFVPTSNNLTYIYKKDNKEKINRN